MSSEYHIPVLLSECIDGLKIQSNGIYVDATYGGGGHSKEIIKNLGADGRLVGFDQDEDALRNALDDTRFTFILSNFRYLERFLKLHDLGAVDGILADLGVSSHQFDEADRGFSYRFDGPLDMRMNAHLDRTAADILNEAGPNELIGLFQTYGEVRNTKTLVRAILEARNKKEFASIADLVALADKLAIGNKLKYKSQVFQALRIAVNDEVEALSEFLIQSLDVLKPGGRLVVVTYHSVEDRIVKRFMKSGQISGQLRKDEYGRIFRPFELITRKPIVPTADEIKINRRARSAKLRIAEKRYV